MIKMTSFCSWQEDKRFHEGDGADLQAQLIAEAIAAFDTNNEQRIKLGRDPLDEKVRISTFFPVVLRC
jgi:hypothetical protein